MISTSGTSATLVAASSTPRMTASLRWRPGLVCGSSEALEVLIRFPSRWPPR